MIRVHKASSGVAMLIDETQFIFIPTAENGCAMVDCFAKEIVDYFEDDIRDVVYLRESLEEIESLIRISKHN